MLAHPHTDLYSCETQAWVAYVGTGPKTVVVDQLVPVGSACRIHSFSSSEVMGSSVGTGNTSEGHGIVRVDVVRVKDVIVVLE